MAQHQGTQGSSEKVTSGAKKNIGKTWHPELEDKLKPFSTHAYHAIDQCNGNPSAHRISLLNAVEHYKNNHSNCLHIQMQNGSQLRALKDRDNIPESRRIAGKCHPKSMLYRFAQTFVLGRKTGHAESFTNTMNMFHDKRSFYEKEEYAVRSHIAVMHWDENVGRANTSVCEAPDNPPESVVLNPDVLTWHQHMNTETMHGNAIWIVFIFKSNIAKKGWSLWRISKPEILICLILVYLWIFYKTTLLSVAALDEDWIPPTRLPACCVINTDNSGDGQHWVSFFIDTDCNADYWD